MSNALISTLRFSKEDTKPILTQLEVLKERNKNFRVIKNQPTKTSIPTNYRTIYGKVRDVAND